MKEGGKEGGKEGRKEERKEGRRQGRKEGRKEERKEEVSIKGRKGGKNIAIEKTWKKVRMVINEFLELVKVSYLLSYLHLMVTNCNFSAYK